MSDDNIYLGSPGAIQQIYWPFGGIDGTRPRDTTIFRTGAGGARMSRMLNGVRTYTLDYGGLGRENFAILEAYDQGHMGPGPFVFLDAGRRNLLSANQSSAGSFTNDTTDFTLIGGATGHAITSDASQKVLRPRTIKWSYTSTNPATVQLNLDSPSKFWPGIPIITRQYTFSLVALGLVGSVTFQVEIDWLDILGTTVLATSTSGLVGSVVNAWAPYWVTATPPATAVWAKCYVAPQNTSITAGEALHMADFQFNEGPREGWSPGTGICPVQVVSHRDIQPDGVPSFRKGNTLVLQEVK